MRREVKYPIRVDTTLAEPDLAKACRERVVPRLLLAQGQAPMFWETRFALHFPGYLSLHEINILHFRG